MSIIPHLKWRYATKRMSDERVEEQKIQSILEAIRLSPSSSGLQPFEVFVITNPALKNEIQKAAFNQKAVGECSHLLVFAGWKTYTDQRISVYFDIYEKERNLPKGFSDDYKIGVSKQLQNLPENMQFEHAAKQIYIALGFALAEAAALKVDALPMEGFLPNQVDELLGLEKQDLKSVLLLPLGYRDKENDRQINQPKVRKNHQQLFRYIE